MIGIRCEFHVYGGVCNIGCIEVGLWELVSQLIRKIISNFLHAWKRAWISFAIAVFRKPFPPLTLTILLSIVIGILAGYGSYVFSLLIYGISYISVEPVLELGQRSQGWLILLCAVPAIGLFLVAWFTQKYAPEAMGTGVPEVIVAVSRHDGVIRPRVGLCKILASGVSIGTGGSVGRGAHRADRFRLGQLGWSVVWFVAPSRQNSCRRRGSSRDKCNV